MLKIVAKSKIKEGKMDQYLETVAELVKKSQAEEGNVAYTVNALRGAENVVAFIEIWKDQAAFDFHVKTEHFTSILPKLRDFVEEGYPAEIYDEVEF